ncbi:hypothetical protein HG531_004931 [Fusarium graminearum]|nr:hypothetical protein HG531_004931 [Fusarium graminearum]
MQHHPQRRHGKPLVITPTDQVVPVVARLVPNALDNGHALGVVRFHAELADVVLIRRWDKIEALRAVLTHGLDLGEFGVYTLQDGSFSHSSASVVLSPAWRIRSLYSDASFWNARAVGDLLRQLLEEFDHSFVAVLRGHEFEIPKLWLKVLLALFAIKTNVFGAHHGFQEVIECLVNFV